MKGKELPYLPLVVNLLSEYWRVVSFLDADAGGKLLVVPLLLLQQLLLHLLHVILRQVLQLFILE